MTATTKTWVDEVAAIATMADVDVTESDVWFVCLCTDHRHGIEDRASDPTPHRSIAEHARLYVGGSHIVHARRVVLDEVTAVPS
ncbi:hypothetical protein [Actinotalea sp. Marseille-Q4924]|uniref:hypothetical protein n=1 Tax=Actinotalea sp. Marseille-Q4924 TaxID=2866571 RepID=UPI001CE3C5B2|nr:hypothetical protein [Actinotalea sp. Marseille-Q4924]